MVCVVVADVTATMVILPSLRLWPLLQADSCPRYWRRGCAEAASKVAAEVQDCGLVLRVLQKMECDPLLDVHSDNHGRVLPVLPSCIGVVF